ncbi:Hypothetical predicted protein [Cloeon dipterum]|uniref:Uncharacterized protein n=1 Tax=Cloeon dipterum TaxID=197152 RepID=A0A8S1DXD4_9INSE|nr:Hypothetical predicted protein [Cloeon dipterum]
MLGKPVRVARAKKTFSSEAKRWKRDATSRSKLNHAPVFVQATAPAASREGADEGARIDVKDKKVLEPCLLAKMLEDHAMAQLQRLIGPATTVPTRASTFKKPLTTT